MLQAVIFDFDGIITDSEILHFRTFNQVLAPHGIQITKTDYYKHYLGLSDFDLLNLLNDKGLINVNQQQIRDFITQKNCLFEQMAKTEGKIIDGVRGFLEILRQNNITMAICSGALLAEIELVLQQAQLRPYFQAIVSAEQVEKGKPHPQGLLLTLQKLNEANPAPIAPEQCIVIEDSHWGLNAAKAAGMHTIAVTNSYHADQLKPCDKVIANLNELTLADLQKLCA